jgi:hypothetical protein
MKGKVDFLLGKHMDQKGLELMHISSTDCTHWLQPGMHDVLAAELGEFLLNDDDFSNISKESVGTWHIVPSLYAGVLSQVVGTLAFVGVGCIFCLTTRKGCKYRYVSKGNKR